MPHRGGTSNHWNTMRKLFLFIAFALASLTATAGSPKNSALKVMSFNIRQGTADDGTNSWDFRGSASLEMIKDQAPDVIGLQEAIYDQVRFLEYFLDDYKCVGVGRDDGKKKGEFMEIFYNKKTVSLLKWGTFWLSETPDKVSKGWDAACFRTATWALMKDKKTGNRFYFVDTHIDHKGEQAQANGVTTLLSEMDKINSEGLPVVVVGDFNMRPSDQSLNPIKAVMKCTRDVAAMTDMNRTFNNWGKAPADAIIDYIWFNGFSSCSEYETVTKKYENKVYVSDHYPIRSVLFF